MRIMLATFLVALFSIAWGVTGPPVYADTGYGIGQVLPDLTAVDQHGDATSLHERAGEVTVLHLCAGWCVPCRQLAAETPGLLEELDRTFGPDRVRMIEVLLEGRGGWPADQAFAAAWSQLSDGMVPVLHPADDPAAAILELAQLTWVEPTGGVQAFPTLVYLDRGMRIVSVTHGWVSASQISASVAEAFETGGPITAEEALTDLRTALDGTDVRPGIREALTSGLERVEAALAADDEAAVERTLGAFEQQLQAMSRGQQIPAADAAALTDLVQAVVDLI